MSHDHSASDSLIQRLVVDRLAAPGVLDRSQLQRTHDRLTHATSSHVLDRLQRRVASTATSGAELPLVRAQRVTHSDAESPAAAPSQSAVRSAMSDGFIGTKPTTVNAATSPAPAIARSTSLPGQLVVARQIASVAPAAGTPRELVARRSSGIPEAGAAGVTAPALSVFESPAIPAHGLPSMIPAPAPVVKGVVQRAAASDNVIRAAAPAAGGAQIAMPLTARGQGADASTASSVTTMPAPLPRASASAGMSTLERVSPRLLLRKADAATRAAAAGSPTVSSTPMSSATMQLVSRTPDAALAAAQSTALAVPSSTLGVATGDAEAQAAPRQRAWSSAGHLDIDWITEQVGSRLARRLEIDRERQGVRQWRQVS